MSKPLAIIKHLKKAIEDIQRYPEYHLQNDLERSLRKKGLTKELILSVADVIGTSLKITSKNADELEWFANFLGSYLHEFVKSIQIYLEIIKVVAHKSSIYRSLMEVYFYDLDTLVNFDFVENAVSQFTSPSEWVDPIFYCMSYTYMGILLQRLGRFWDARRVFNMAARFHRDPRKLTRTAEHANIELDYLASMVSKDLLQRKEVLSTANNKPLIIVGCVFFGSVYRQLFQKSAGASFFCKNNLELLKKDWNPIVVIFCTFFDKISFERSKFYQEISSFVPIEIHVIPERLISKHPDLVPPAYEMTPSLAYSLSGLLQTCLLAIAKRWNASLINLPPDAIFSDIAVAEITRVVNKGYKVIFTPGIRLNRETVLDEVSKLTEHNNASTFGISPAQLTELAFNNLHPATEASFCTREKMTYPGFLLWPTEKGLFGHYFQMHPIFIKSELLQHTPIRRFDSIDGDFVYLMLPCPEDWQRNIHIITEPRKVIMFELSGPDIPVDIKYDTNNLAQSAGSWIAKVMRPLSFWLLTKRVAFGNTKNVKNNLIAHMDNVISDLVKLGNGLNSNRLPNPAAILEKADSNLETLIENWKPGSSNYKTAPSKLGTSVDAIGVIYSLAVWGRRYIENFLNICLPSLLAEDNLGNLTNNKYSLFLLYTRDEDIPLFEETAQFQKLKRIISVEIVPLDPQQFKNKYTVLSNAQSDTVQRSHCFDAICFLYSDFLWAKGGIKFCLQKLAEGYEGVVSPVPPVLLEDFYEVLNSHFTDFVQYTEDGIKDFNISITPRTLVHYAKPILHPMMRDNNVSYNLNTGNPAYVLWLGPGDDLLIRCFHSHPVMLKVKHDTPEYWIPFDKTLDEWFLPSAYPATDRLYFIQDSDELAVISLTEEDFPTPYVGENHHLDAVSIAQWAESCGAPMHKIMFNYYTLWHEHELILSNWQQTIDRSKITAAEVQWRLSMPDLVAQSESSKIYLARKDRALRFGKKDIIETISIRPELNEANKTNLEKKQAIFSSMLVNILSLLLSYKVLQSVARSFPPRVKAWRSFASLKDAFETRQARVLNKSNSNKSNPNKFMNRYRGMEIKFTHYVPSILKTVFFSFRRLFRKKYDDRNPEPKNHFS
ncbi:hypothetical protein [Coxiella burnetii]|uniref:hypothetical protein n=1 Tax=Coxiella burnetii TaxID=777 RepID=UPI000589EA8C|nr:hypothetical protein [Coxiella burnetii]